MHRIACLGFGGMAPFELGVVCEVFALPRPFTAEAVAALPPGELVTYCWGPGCNGATKAALELARLGRPVREMIGGYEYWQREGHPVITP